MSLLTPQEVAERLKVSVKTVQRLTSRGELRAVFPTRYPRYTEREVDAYQISLEGSRRRRRVA
jgi:excisionase family DNA binding protein